MNDEDFKTTVFDYFDIATQRDLRLMATLTDITTEIAAIKTSHASLKAAIEKALADLAATGAAGHAAVLDAVVTDLKDTRVTMDADTTEITAAIMAVPVPSATPTP